jgi:hypothetical protein
MSDVSGIPGRRWKNQQQWIGFSRFGFDAPKTFTARLSLDGGYTRFSCYPAANQFRPLVRFADNPCSFAALKRDSRSVDTGCGQTGNNPLG